MRKTNRFWQALIIFTAIVSFGLFSQQNQQVFAKTLTVGTSNTFEPYEIEDKNGGYDDGNNGFEMDLFKEIMKNTGMKYEIKIMSFNAQIQSVQSGQLDLMLNGMSVTEERKAKFDFTDSFYDAGAVLAVNKKSKINSLKDLKGKTVGVKVGTTGAEYAQSINKKYGFKIKYFNESNPMWQDVENGGIDGSIDEEVVLRYGIRNGLDLKVVTKPADSMPIAIAVKKGHNQEFIKKFNVELAKMKKSGRLQEIIDQYLGENAKIKTDTASERTIFGLIKKNAPLLGNAILETLKISVIGILTATIFGVLLGVLGIQRGKILPGIASTIIYLFRGLPMMVLAFFIYIGLPDVIGQKIPLVVAAIITLTLNEGAYIGAFVKGGFESVDKGQWEASRSLGMSYQRTLWKVIAPQGIKYMIPSFLNQFIITIKDTSILSAIGLMELTQTGSVIIAKNMEGFNVWAIIAVIYLIIITSLTWLSKLVERRIR